MKQRFFYTGAHWTGFITRIFLGLLMLPHGLQKTFGLFGGYGFTGTMNYFTETLHMPYLIGVLVILIESAGAILLIAGYAARFWSIAFLLLMAGAVSLVHVPNGWFMNWNGTLQGEGYEYHLAIAALCIITFINGAGKYSVDRSLSVA